MSQHDYVIENQTFPATRADLNNAFGAIVSQNSGASAPSTTYAYQLWYDTSNNKLKQRNADNDAWIDLFDVNQTTDVATASSAGTFTNDINMSGGTLKILFTRNDTTTIAGNPLGAIEFAHTDTDDAGTAAKIIGEGNGTAGEGRLAFYAGTPSALTEKLRIDSDGLKFNGDTSADNALDDYEEGTWTPAMSSSSGTAPSPSAVNGIYTKIGREVTVTAIISNITKGGTDTAEIRVGGLPFTPNTQDSFGACLFGHVTFSDPEVTGQAASVDASADVVRFFVSRDGGGRAAIDNQHIDTGVSDLFFTISYITSQ